MNKGKNQSAIIFLISDTTRSKQLRNIAYEYSVVQKPLNSHGWSQLRVSEDRLSNSTGAACGQHDDFSKKIAKSTDVPG